MEKKKSQKDVVFKIVCDVLGELYSAEKPMRKYFEHAHKSSYLEKHRERLHPEAYERTKKAVTRFVDLINSRQIQRPKNCFDERDLFIYGRRILFNWLRKDPRLNGGKKYSPTSSPRSGGVPAKINYALKQLAGDEQIDELLKLYVQVMVAGSIDGMKEVKEALLERVYEIAKEELRKTKAA